MNWIALDSFGQKNNMVPHNVLFQVNIACSKAQISEHILQKLKLHLHHTNMTLFQASYCLSVSGEQRYFINLACSKLLFLNWIPMNVT